VEYIFGYLLGCSLAILVVFIYGLIMGLMMLCGAGFFTKKE
jgi:hypothetical protein